MTELGDLVRRCRDGDERAARDLVRRFQQPVFRLCLRMLGHWEDAEDVAQESLARALRHLHHWDETRPLMPWLMAIAANRCRTALGQRRRRPRPTEVLPDDPGGDASTRIDLAEELQQALDRLREDYRLCFVLFYEQEWSCADISETMGVPPGTVKTWLHRARKELAEYLERRGVAPEVNRELHRI